jgi:hypothetical protein
MASLSLTYGISLSRVFVSEARWLSDDSPFLRNARPEAMPA